MTPFTEIRVPAREAIATTGKGSFVRDLMEGQEFEGTFLVQRKSLRRTREGRPFLGLLLYDSSGAIDAQVWEDSEAFRVPFAERDFLRVRGVVDRFRDRLQLRVLACTVCRWEDLEPEDFLPVSSRTPAEMRAELRARIRSVTQPHLRALLERFEADAGLMNALALSPAATAVHHDVLGGLLEHTLSLMSLADAVARVYPDVDRDLLLAGAFLHDVGKIRELQPVPGFPYTDEGRLIGHIVLGYEIAMRKIDEVPGFPRELRTQVGHLILSHQGEHEWGAPKRPQTLEAIVLHYLDNLDSKVNVARKAFAATGEAGGGGGEGKLWTEYVRILGRALYRGAGRGPEAVRESAPQRGTLERDAAAGDPLDLFDGGG